MSSCDKIINSSEKGAEKKSANNYAMIATTDYDEYKNIGFSRLKMRNFYKHHEIVYALLTIREFFSNSFFRQ